MNMRLFTPGRDHLRRVVSLNVAVTGRDSWRVTCGSEPHRVLQDRGRFACGSADRRIRGRGFELEMALRLSPGDPAVLRGLGEIIPQDGAPQSRIS